MFGVEILHRWIGPAIVFAAFTSAYGDENQLHHVYGQPKQLGRLANSEINESSGLAASNRHKDVFWTHNDSGDTARLFAFDRGGKHLGTSRLRGANAKDWEAMGSFVHKRTPYLFAADVGNNPLRPMVCVIYIAAEPPVMNQDLDVVHRIEFTYSDRKGHDCEAVAFDPRDNHFVLVEKHNPRTDPRLDSGVWLLAWDPTKKVQQQVASRVGALKLPVVTGFDISSDGSRCIAVTYLNIGVQFTRRPGEDWATALKKPVDIVALPGRKQGEAVCFGNDGSSLFLTSEGLHSPFFSIPVTNAALQPKWPVAGNPSVK